MFFEMEAATVDQTVMTFNPVKLHSAVKIPFPKSSSAESEFFVYNQADLFAQSFSAMEGIRRMGKLCDVTLKVNRVTFFFFLPFRMCNDFLYVLDRWHVVQRPSRRVGGHRTVFQRNVHTRYDRKHPERHRHARNRPRVSILIGNKRSLAPLRFFTFFFHYGRSNWVSKSWQVKVFRSFALFFFFFLFIFL